MNIRRLVAAVAALSATLSLVVSGCGTGKSHTDTSPTGQQVDARGELTAAARLVTEQTLRIITEKPDVVVKGVMDPQGRTGTITAQFEKTDRMIWVTVYEDDIYFSLYGLPDISFGIRFWLPRSEVPADSHLDVMRDDDPSGARQLVDAIVSVQRDGERSATGQQPFAGLVDLMATPYGNENLRQEFGDKVHAVPFTAAVDDQGRLVEFLIALDTLAPKLGTIRTVWSDFGMRLNPQRPKTSQPAGDVRGLLQRLDD